MSVRFPLAAVKGCSVSTQFQGHLLSPRSFPNPPSTLYSPRMAKLSPIESEFATTEGAETHDAWVRTKVEKALASTKPPIPHAQVMAEAQAILDKV
jgi:hypothetical protein